MFGFFLVAGFCTTLLTDSELSSQKEIGTENPPAGKLRRVNAVDDLRKLLEETEDIIEAKDAPKQDVVEMTDGAIEQPIDEAAQNEIQENDSIAGPEEKGQEEEIALTKTTEETNLSDHNETAAAETPVEAKVDEAVVNQKPVPKATEQQTDSTAEREKQPAVEEINPVETEDFKIFTELWETEDFKTETTETTEEAKLFETKDFKTSATKLFETKDFKTETTKAFETEDFKTATTKEIKRVETKEFKTFAERFEPKDFKTAPKEEQAQKSGEKTNTEETRNIPRKKVAKFKIDSVIPNTISALGGEELTIETNETVVGPVFCKFNDKIVSGRHGEGRKLMCIAPELPEGDVTLSVSIDKTKWCREIVITVLSDDSDMPWIVVAIGSAAVLGIAFMAVKMLCWKRKVPKRKAPKKRPFNQDPFEVRQKIDKRENLRNRRKMDSMI